MTSEEKNEMRVGLVLGLTIVLAIWLAGLLLCQPEPTQVLPAERSLLVEDKI